MAAAEGAAILIPVSIAVVVAPVLDAPVGAVEGEHVGACPRSFGFCDTPVVSRTTTDRIAGLLGERRRGWKTTLTTDRVVAISR